MTFTNFSPFFFLPTTHTHTHDPRPTTFSYTPNLWRDTMVARLTSDFKTFHITLKSQTTPITRLEGAFLKYQQYLKTVFLTAFSPRPLPHRFLSRPRFSLRAAESLTLRTTKEETDQKIPPAPQAFVITRVVNSLSLF